MAEEVVVRKKLRCQVKKVIMKAKIILLGVVGHTISRLSKNRTFGLKCEQTFMTAENFLASY